MKNVIEEFNFYKGLVNELEFYKMPMTNEIARFIKNLGADDRKTLIKLDKDFFEFLEFIYKSYIEENYIYE